MQQGSHLTPFTPILDSVHTKDMTTDTNGTISWADAVQYVSRESSRLLHGYLMVSFAFDYGHLTGERIDLGELQTWHDVETDMALAALLNR